MEQKNNLRQLYILQYLYERTDENHPATNMDILPSSFRQRESVSTDKRFPPTLRFYVPSGSISLP